MNFYKNLLMSLTLTGLLLAGQETLAAGMGIGTPVTVDSRIKTFVYNQNEVFPVVFNYGYHSYIEFSKGETVTVMALGDNTNWKIKPVDNKLYIMPLEKQGHTNMLLETSKGRSYAFDLISKSVPLSEGMTPTSALGSDDSVLSDLVYVVRFYYPQSEREFDVRGNKLKISAPSLYRDAQQNDDVVIEPNPTRVNYTFAAGSTDVHLAPVLAFDDGYLTYFKFGGEDQAIPKIYVVDEDGNRKPCRMLFLKGYVIIEGVHSTMYLDFGNKGVKVVNQALG